MTDRQAEQFAEEWIENFNRGDEDAVLAHFAEHATFTSPRALKIAGRETLASRGELSAYWKTALRSIRSLHFTLDRVVHDSSARRIAMVYLSEIDGDRRRAVEIYDFDESGRVIRGEAMYGAGSEP
ncbi:MAG TPA: nuclear transport factor 2 family protein [Bryobacteraceae bacterium]|jgi:hypothetical protein